MKIIFTFLIICLFLGYINPVKAAVVQNTITIQLGQLYPSNAPRTLQIPKFNPQLGKLLSARYEIQVTGIRISAVEDKQPYWSGPVNFLVRDRLSGSLSLPGVTGSSLFSINLDTSLTVLAPYDKINDFAGTSGTTNAASDRKIYNGTFSNLSLVSGNGTFPITHTSEVSWSVDAESGNYSFDQDTYISLRAAITYTYDSIPLSRPIPGPGN